MMRESVCDVLQIVQKPEREATLLFRDCQYENKKEFAWRETRKTSKQFAKALLLFPDKELRTMCTLPD